MDRLVYGQLSGFDRLLSPLRYAAVAVALFVTVFDYSRLRE